MTTFTEVNLFRIRNYILDIKELTTVVVLLTYSN